MKDSYPQIGLTRFCRLFGITRQAFYQHFWNLSDTSVEQALILQEVREIRKIAPGYRRQKIILFITAFFTGAPDQNG